VDAAKPSTTDKGKPTDDLEDEDEDATSLDLSEDEDLSEDDTDESADADADQTDEDEDEDDKAKAPVATDGHRVEITVDGETKSVTVKELKRLFGQEASLTRKSQEVATAKKTAELDGERYMIASQRLLTKAEARFAPFEKIDWMVAQTRLSPDEFSALRDEARDAYTEVNFLKAEADDVLNTLAETRQGQTAEAAREAITVLTRDIPGWNREVYDKVRSFAVTNGMDAEVVNGLVDPAAIKLIHMAMRYQNLKSNALTKKAKAKAAPKRVVKPGRNRSDTLGTMDPAAAAKARAKSTGSRDDAMAALMAGWQSDGDD
jgi:hypothetical protein